MIVLEKVTKKYNSITAASSVYLTCAPNETVVLVGSSGSGKSTLLRLIAGLEKVDDGRIVINNQTVSTEKLNQAPHKRSIALVFQGLALWPHMTVEEHLKFVLKGTKLCTDSVQSTIDTILDELELTRFNKRYPHELSGGEQQRIAIARAIIAKPSFLLMDEPFSHLDPFLTESLCRLLIDLKKKHSMGIILVSHNSSDVFTLADTVAVMKEGCIVQCAHKDEITRNPLNQYVAKLLQPGYGIHETFRN